MADITIAEGNTLQVDYDVENLGTLEDTKDVDLVIDDGSSTTIEDTDTITLTGGEVQSDSLFWETVAGEEVPAGETETFDAIVQSPDDTDLLTVAVDSAIPDSVVHLGGLDDSGNEVDTIYAYDPATDSISTQSATLPTALRFATSAAVDGTIYHFGGYDGSNEVDTIYAYDPATDSISTQSATLPTALRRATSAAV